MFLQTDAVYESEPKHTNIRKTHLLKFISSPHYDSAGLRQGRPVKNNKHNSVTQMHPAGQVPLHAFNELTGKQHYFYRGI